MDSRTAFSVDFLSLPRKARDAIYRKLLVLGHPIYLFQDSGSQVIEAFAPDRPVRWLAVLYANRQVQEEASTVLYGSNHFNFVDTTQHQVDLIKTFLDRIGSVNAGHLSHLCINFPALEKVQGEAGRFKLREDGLRSLKLLQEKCPSLTTLETFVHSQNSMGLTKANQDSDESQSIREVLSQIDAQLKAITSLNKIIVSYYSGPLTPEVTELMQSFGWDVLPGR